MLLESENIVYIKNSQTPEIQCNINVIYFISTGIFKLIISVSGLVDDRENSLIIIIISNNLLILLFTNIIISIIYNKVAMHQIGQLKSAKINVKLTRKFP